MSDNYLNSGRDDYFDYTTVISIGKLTRRGENSMHVISHNVHPGKRAQSQKVKKNCSDKALHVIRSFVR